MMQFQWFQKQYFLGDLAECQRQGVWRSCRVSRVPSDEKPHDGSFRVKFDDDAEEMKCWYKDLRVADPRQVADVPPWWRHGRAADAQPISLAERQREAQLWQEHRQQEEMRSRERQAQREEFATLGRTPGRGMRWMVQVNQLNQLLSDRSDLSGHDLTKYHLDDGCDQLLSNQLAGAFD
eukprot:Skav217201  [mRNA]  locus=scaffold3544:28226:30556:+ [translate_table: standard]